MTVILTVPSGDYTRDAHAAILHAVHNEPDFSEWLAGVLATAAAQLGSTDALTGGCSGSWEAALVHQLVKGTVGADDDSLDYYREPRP